MIQNYDDFITVLLDAGFSMGSGSSDGIYAVLPWNWSAPPPENTSVRWHTGDADTDPWEWRMRVVEERSDIAYAKLFFKKSGFITKEWYPRFLAVRRVNLNFEEAYAMGTVSHFAKRIYDVVASGDSVPIHTIKKLAGFSREDKSGFDRALTELQMRMFITICGRQQKITENKIQYKPGEPLSGWSSTVFCTVEKFFGEEIINKAAAMDADTAGKEIKEQILKLNPSAQEKKMVKFIYGN
jgi:hypothetical protein